MTDHVIVADDTPDMRLLLRTVLTSAGVAVVGEAADGAEALAVWRAQRTAGTECSVVLDQRMPGQSGLEVACQILAESPGTMVVLFSAYVDDELRAEAASIGVADCIGKEDIMDLPGRLAELSATRH